MDKITKMRDIVTAKTAGKVNGYFVDIFSASRVLAVYDRLQNPSNKAKYANMPVSRMVEIAFKLTK